MDKWCRLLGSILVSLTTSTVSAEVFEVNSIQDGVDANPGDGVCQTRGGSCTFRAAIQESNALIGKDEVRVPAGNYKPVIGSSGEGLEGEGDFDITDDLVVVGEGSGVTVLDGGRTQRIFNIVEKESGFYQVEISGFTLTQGLDDIQGSVIRNSGSLMLSDLVVTDAGVHCASIYNERRASLVIEDSEFTKNHHAIFNDGERLEIESSIFSENLAYGDEGKTHDCQWEHGGAIISRQGKSVIKNSRFIQNRAENKGGALYFTSN